MLPRAGSSQGLLLLLNSPFCCCWAEQGGEEEAEANRAYVCRRDWLAPGADALGCPDVIGCWSPAPTPIFPSAEPEGWVSGGKRRRWARRPPQDQCPLQPERPRLPKDLGWPGAYSLRPKEGLRTAQELQCLLQCTLSHSVSSLLFQKREEWEEEMLSPPSLPLSSFAWNGRPVPTILAPCPLSPRLLSLTRPVTAKP